MMLELKPLSKEGMSGALAKAERYRLLNEPSEAESICLDILHVDAENQQALVTLLLALTDQFADGVPGIVARAREILPSLHRDYDRAYYAGIICERRARALLRQDAPGSTQMASEWFREAMMHYERAEPIRPQGNDDALLRWNACARFIMRHPQQELTPEERMEQFLE